MIILRPHHIRSFRNFNLHEEYKLSDDEFVKSFSSRNKKMAHSREFIIYFKEFLTDLRNDPDRRILCKSDHSSVVCENCDIKDRCIVKDSALFEVAARQDKKAMEEMGIYEGEIVVAGRFL